MKRPRKPLWWCGFALLGTLALAACGASTAAAGTTPASAAAPSSVVGSAPNGAPASIVASAPTGAAAAEAAGGDEPNVTYADPAGQFSFLHPQSWGKTTQPGESIRYTGRDEYISIKVVNTTQAALDYANSDAAALAAASPGYKAQPLKPYKVAGTNGAMVAYTWQAGPSPVTGKTVPSSANRYYIPGAGGKLAVFSYSSPTQSYDPAGANDFANAFKWLK